MHMAVFSVLHGCTCLPRTSRHPEACLVRPTNSPLLIFVLQGWIRAQRLWIEQEAHHRGNEGTEEFNQSILVAEFGLG